MHLTSRRWGTTIQIIETQTNAIVSFLTSRSVCWIVAVLLIRFLTNPEVASLFILHPALAKDAMSDDDTGDNTITTYTGAEVAIEPVDQLSSGGARIDVDQVEGPRWRVDVTRTGQFHAVVTTWDCDGQLADVDAPAWLDDVLARLRRV